MYRVRFFSVLTILAIVIGIFFIAIGPKKTASAVANIGNSIFRLKRSVAEGLTEGAQLSESKNTLINQKNELLNTLKEQEASIATLTTIQDENAKLTEMLARKKETTQLIMARILAKPNQSPYDTLVIDAGSAEGMRYGAKVFARGDIPIGTIAESDTHASKVKLFSTSGEKTKAVIVGKDIFIDLEGQGGGTFQTTLPRDVVIEKGTAVATIDDGSTIAIMEETLADSRDPFQRILFRSPVNIFELRFVGVEK